MLTGKAALVASVGGERGYADWTNPDHRFRRLLSEFIGMAGLTFVLSEGRRGNLSTWWVYLIGPVVGATVAVGMAYVLRGPAKAQEASAAEGTPLKRTA
jgi:hypothetical protein